LGTEIRLPYFAEKEVKGDTIMGVKKVDFVLTLSGNIVNNKICQVY